MEITNHNGLESDSDHDVTNTARPLTNDMELPKLHRQKRHEIEIHRVIKRRPKIPAPPPRRKPRPRRPPKPKVKYGPPNINFPPLSHYSPHSFDDTFSTSYETSFSDHNSFAEPPVSYGSPIQPSPAFGSPPFAYGQGTTSYQGSTFGRPNFESTSFEGFGKPSLASSNLNGFDPSKYPGLLDSPSHSSHSQHPSAGKIPTFGGHFSQSSFTNSKQPSYQSSPSFIGDSSNFNFNKDQTSFTHHTETPKNQFPLESFRQNPFRTPLTSYEVPISHTKSNLFEPTKDFDSLYKKNPNTYSTSSISSTHSTSHSSTDEDDDEYYPSLPNRYEQDQFHTPAKPNPNKSLVSSVQTINDNDPFSNLNSYYDGVSESQRVSVKTKTKLSEPPPEDGFSIEELYSPVPSTVNRNKIRRKKKPKPVTNPVAHNLDTDDLRDAYGSSSDFHQVAIDADEFLEFEPQKQMKHSKPVGIAMTRDEDKFPANFVLQSSQNRGKENNTPNYKKSPGNPNYARKIPSSSQTEYKAVDLYKSAEGKRSKPPAQKSSGLEDVNILSIQKSNSKTYYAGSNEKEPLLYSGFLPTRRNGAYYRANLDYETLDADDENYDEIGDVGTFSGKIQNSRVKKDVATNQNSEEFISSEVDSS